MKQLSTIYRSIRPQATVTAIVFSYGSDLSAVTDHTPQHKQVTTGRHGKAWHRHKSVAQK